MRVPAVLTFLAAVLTACGGSDDSTGPGDTYSGTYTLRTIDGQSLPFLQSQLGTTEIEVVSDTLVVSENSGSFTKRMTIRVTADGEVRPNQIISDAGVYTRTGTTATFQFNSQVGGCVYCNSNSTAVGTSSGGTITFIDGGGVPWVYRK